MRHLGPSRDQSGGSIWEVDLRVWRVDSEVILGPFLDPYLRNLIISLKLPSFGRR